MLPSLFTFWSLLFTSLLSTPTEADLQILSLEQVPPEVASGPQITQLLEKGVSFEHEDTIGLIPAQSKDFYFIEAENGKHQVTLTEAFTDYVVKSIQNQIEVAPKHLTLLAADPNSVSKVTMVGEVKNGIGISESLLRVQLKKSLLEGKTQVQVPSTLRKGEVINATGIDLGPLEELAEGKSTFWGSSPEREFNIRKALNERFNGVLIPPGAEFSYVDLLGPIEWAGWKQATTIFQGTNLEKAPAGGVCQVSTTIYRAGLDAGLEFTEHRHHSLYVIYYNEYGDGLDATIFPGEQDLKFINNTPKHLLMTASEEGYYEAVIRFYGQDDGRSTTLIGPYTGSNQSEETRTQIGELGIGEMAWDYLITHADGTSTQQWIRSSYMSPAKQHKEAPGKLDTSLPPIKTGP
jgi:vancomycin resistance protein YoaR